MASRYVRDSGETLIESLLSLLFVATAIAAIVGGVAATATLSGDQRKLTVSDVALKAVTESIKQATYSIAGSYVVPPGVVPSGYTATVGSVRCWKGDAGPTYGTTSFAVCNGSNDHGLQLVPVVVVSTDHRASETAEIMKRS
jgi:hypothetical protein